MLLKELDLLLGDDVRPLMLFYGGDMFYKPSPMLQKKRRLELELEPLDVDDGDGAGEEVDLDGESGGSGGGSVILNTRPRRPRASATPLSGVTPPEIVPPDVRPAGKNSPTAVRGASRPSRAKLGEKKKPGPRPKADKKGIDLTGQDEKEKTGGMCHHSPSPNVS